MRHVRLPSVLFAVLALGFLLYLAGSASLLPERVATHFGLGGRPDGWMSRSGYLAFTGILGIALPLFIVGLAFLSRFLPAGMVNIPHREYWLAPAHRAQTHAYLLGHCWWMACLVIGFMAGIHYLTIQANNSLPVGLPSAPFLVLLAAFLGGVALWTMILMRHFSRPVR